MYMSRQGTRFSIRMVTGMFCYDTETGAATPPLEGPSRCDAEKVEAI